MKVLDYLVERNQTHHDKTFVADLYRSVTYGEFYQLVLKKASGLNQIGVKPEDRVLLVLEHGIDHLMSYFACMHLGAIPVHLNTSKPKKSIIQAAEITTAKYCLVDGYSEDMSDVPFQLLAFNNVSDEIKEGIEGECDIAYMMFTSGTTGVPKAVMTSHSNTIATASSILDFAKMTDKDRELISLPLSFTFGLGHIHALIMVGGEAYLTNRRYEVGFLASEIKKQQATGFLASPGMLKDMVANHREAVIDAGSSLKYLVVNCTPMHPSLTSELLELLPQTQLYMYYGSTEASRCAFIHYNRNRHRLDFTGKHTLNVELKIDAPDENGVGEICMRGPNVMPGYWNNPEATKKAIDEDNWIHSGDFGIMDEDGYVKVIGRMNDEISVDGMKCQPVEVETIVLQLDFVKEATVCAIPDAEKYQVVGVAVVLDQTVPAQFKQVIRTHCSRLLEPFKVPVIIEEMDKIPANELGKINRKELIKMLTPETESHE
ncbi:MAG: class I adenylate-forming enzyme family protein [Crocinitomicaceae bacterium]